MILVLLLHRLLSTDVLCVVWRGESGPRSVTTHTHTHTHTLARPYLVLHTLPPLRRCGCMIQQNCTVSQKTRPRNLHFTEPAFVWIGEIVEEKLSCQGLPRSSRVIIATVLMYWEPRECLIDALVNYFLKESSKDVN